MPSLSPFHLFLHPSVLGLNLTMGSTYPYRRNQCYMKSFLQGPFIQVEVVSNPLLQHLPHRWLSSWRHFLKNQSLTLYANLFYRTRKIPGLNLIKPSPLKQIFTKRTFSLWASRPRLRFTLKVDAFFYKIVSFYFKFICIRMGFCVHSAC